MSEAEPGPADKCAICLWPLGDSPHPVQVDHPTLGTREWWWVHEECFAAQLSFESARKASTK